MKDLLDEYFDSAKKEIPIVLKTYLNGLLCSSRIDLNVNFVTLIQEAKRVGIRVYGIDSAESCQMGLTMFGSEGEERMKGMNFIAKTVIEKESKEEKWIA